MSAIETADKRKVIFLQDDPGYDVYHHDEIRFNQIVSEEEEKMELLQSYQTMKR